MKTKNLIKQICPPILWHLISKKFNQIRNSKNKYDLRRWWSGEDLIGSGIRFKKNFKVEDFKIYTAMIDKEIRETIKINPQKKIKINSNNDLRNLEIIFSISVRSLGESTPGNVQVLINGSKIVEISNLLNHKWNNAYFNNLNDKINNIEVVNNTNEILYFACPITFEKFQENEKIKNVFLVVLDQPDFSTFNELFQSKELPFINEFFDKGYNFENLYSVAEWTIPCFDSIFSGKYPSEHGFFDLKCSSTLKENHGENIMSYMNQRSFSTFGVSRSKGHHAGFQFNDDFDRLLYFEDKGISNIDDDSKISMETINHLNLNNNGKNFVFLHFMSTHSPFIKPNISEEKNLNPIRHGDPKKEYNDSIIGYGASKVEPIMDNAKVNSIIDRQKERIKKIDAQLGLLLSFIEKKKQKKNTIFILTSDHGPNHLNKNGQSMMNKMRLNIPLLIYDFNVDKMINVKNFVSQIDIYPIIRSFFEKNPDKTSITLPYGTKSENIISESIFNNLYQASIRNDNHIYNFSCEFDASNLTINLKKILENKVEIMNNNGQDKEEDLLINYQGQIKKHLLKSKKLKILG